MYIIVNTFYIVHTIGNVFKSESLHFDFPNLKQRTTSHVPDDTFLLSSGSTDRTTESGSVFRDFVETQDDDLPGVSHGSLKSPSPNHQTPVFDKSLQNAMTFCFCLIGEWWRDHSLYNAASSRSRYHCSSCIRSCTDWFTINELTLFSFDFSSESHPHIVCETHSKKCVPTHTH